MSKNIFLLLQVAYHLPIINFQTRVLLILIETETVVVVLVVVVVVVVLTASHEAIGTVTLILRILAAEVGVPRKMVATPVTFVTPIPNAIDQLLEMIAGRRTKAIAKIAETTREAEDGTTETVAMDIILTGLYQPAETKISKLSCSELETPVSTLVNMRISPLRLAAIRSQSTLNQ